MTYQLKHPFLGLLIGALFGGFIVSLWFSVPGLISGLAAGEPEQTLQELRDFMPTVMAIAATFFAFGLIFIASPAWVFLHSSGRTHPSPEACACTKIMASCKLLSSHAKLAKLAKLATTLPQKLPRGR